MVNTIRALTKNHCEYITCPFMISASCKSKDACAHMSLLSLAWRVCNQKGGMTLSVATGGSDQMSCMRLYIVVMSCLSPTFIRFLIWLMGHLFASLSAQTTHGLTSTPPTA